MPLNSFAWDTGSVWTELSEAKLLHDRLDECVSKFVSPQALLDRLAGVSGTAPLDIPLMSPNSLTTARFKTSAGLLSFLPRRDLKDVLVVKLAQLAETKNILHLFGNVGGGKSYRLAALAVYLTFLRKTDTNARRVVYVASAKQLKHSCVDGLRKTLTIAFLDDQGSLPQLEHARDQEALLSFVKSQMSQSLVFIVDQWNDVEVDRLFRNFLMDLTSDQLLVRAISAGAPGYCLCTLSVFSVLVASNCSKCSLANALPNVLFRVIGATQMPSAVESRSGDDKSEDIILFGGYNEEEWEQWKAEKLRTSEWTDEAVTELLFLTGRVPLYCDEVLNRVEECVSGKLEGWERDMGAKIESHLTQFTRATVHHTDMDDHVTVLTSSIAGMASKTDARFFDQRYCSSCIFASPLIAHCCQLFFICEFVCFAVSGTSTQLPAPRSFIQSASSSVALSPASWPWKRRSCTLPS